MKILQISNYYLPHIGGIEQVASDFSSILMEAGNEVRIVCFNDGKETLIETYDNQLIYRIGYKFKIFSQAISIKYLFILKKVIKDFAPDVIHVHFPNPLIAFFLCLIKPNCNMTVHWHSDIVNQKKLKKLVQPFVEKILNNAVKIIATTQVYADCSDTLPAYKDKVRIIPCIVNEYNLLNLSNNEKRILEEKRKSYNAKKIIFSMGVHRSYKGLSYLIDACKFLSEEFIVIIAGSGPLTRELKKQAYDNNLRNVEFIGKVTESEKKIYFHLAECFAFPSISKNEAFGIALAEALCCGTPAVTFHIDGSGVNYVSRNNITGLEVRDLNSKKFAEALMNTTKEKYGLNAKEWVLNNFTKKSIKNSVINFFEI